MTSTKQKRLDAVEINLTPKEWAISLVDEFRKYPTMNTFMHTIAKGTAKDSPVFKPYYALLDQADKRYPGNKLEDIRARNKLKRAFQKEYHTLKLLILEINEDITKRGETAGLKAALILTRLGTLVLQDAFGQTVRKAAEWVQKYKVTDTDEEENRQIMLKELVAYRGKWSDSVPLPGGGRIHFPSAIVDWIADVVALIADVFEHRAAVQAVQDRYFDGHSINSGTWKPD